MSNNFTHLHTHTEFSLLDGSAKIKELIKKTKELGMEAISITDHGTMFGVIDFYKEAKKQGIKPILGCEVYVANGSRFTKESTKDNSHLYYHLVLLAENNKGYENLMKLVSLGFTEGYYYKPRIDKELLEQYSEGIIALSACLAGSVPRKIINEGYDAAVKEALSYQNIFGTGNFFLELQDHGIPEQKQVNQKLLQISKDTKIPIVVTNDIHYINREDAKAHDILLCIQTQKNIHDTDRMRYHGDNFFLKSRKEMEELFPYAKEGIENTLEIAKRCNVEIEFHNYKLPKFDLPNNKNSREYLEEICLEGLYKKYKNKTDEEYTKLKERLFFELETIDNMGFLDYFLIVWDFIKFSKDNDIIVGPGRGSAAGSVVSYVLDITNIDPIPHNLLFERFLNPERVSMPDIDIDFCYARRQEVIDYVIEKYGESHVAQIVTFGTMAAKAVIRDVGRALAIPYNEVDKIAKMVPNELKMTINKALKANPDLNTLYENDDTVKTLIDMSIKLEGLPRHSSTHAAGVVICDKPVMDYVPLNQNDGVITTQYSMTTLEELGLLKMDFLGLRTLTVIQNAVKEANRTKNANINIDEIPLDDKEVYKLISDGKTKGVFQLESSGMKAFMQDLKPSTFEDIIAGISIFRPGPMDMKDDYIAWKKNPETIVYEHESLKEILEPTYGCIVYQEQVMQIVRDLAGYSLGRSDLMRRAMSKKKDDVMEQERHNFIYGMENDTEIVDGCIKRGIPKESAEKIFNSMMNFAAYAFNKSHAAAYALIGYQTAYLKRYYKTQFMAALLTSVIDKTDKITEYIQECKKMHIEILPPSVNHSFASFSVENENIRYGLQAVKNVGSKVINNFTDNREKNGKFVSFRDFIDRLNDTDTNKRALESLIKAGAFDDFGGTRSQYFAYYPVLVSGKNYARKHSIAGQISLFDVEISSEDEKNSILKDELPNSPDWSKDTSLGFEKEVLGVYLTGHPLDDFLETLERYISNTSRDLMINRDDVDDDNIEINSSLESSLESSKNLVEGTNVIIGGIISNISIKYTKSNNEAMAFVTLEDLYGTMEIIVFPKIYKTLSHKIVVGNIAIVDGRISARENEDLKVIFNNLRLFDELKKPIDKNIQSIWIKTDKDIDSIKQILLDFKGDMPVKLYNPKTTARTLVEPEFWVDNSSEMLETFNKVFGNTSIAIK